MQRIGEELHRATLGFATRTYPGNILDMCAAPGGFLATAILLFTFAQIQSVVLAMLAMGLASFSSDLTMPISWDACVEIGGPYCATVAASMNMLGNLGGFVAPVVGGIILTRTHGNWNLVIEVMAVLAVISAACWLYLDPEVAGRGREVSPEVTAASSDQLMP